MTQSIQSLERGLQILELLNRQTGLTANQVAKQSGLTRGTAFRVLETLRNLGYLLRDPDSGCYWLQRRVCALADGFIEEAWINQIARPELEALGHELVWPLTITTPSGISMLVRINTDFQSPLSKNRFTIGHRVSLVASASGKAYLAYCEPEHRALLINLVVKSSPRLEDKIARNNQGMRTILSQVRREGFATMSDGDRSAVAVPILSKGHPLASLAMRFFGSAIRANGIRRDVVPLLKGAAEKIARAFETAPPTQMKGATD